MKRVALYVRVSHEEQVRHGISIEAQKTALEMYSRGNNYTIVKTYADEGISARKSYKKRPALLEMISDCQKGKIDLILICKLDRFFRSVSDYYAVMDQIGNVPWKAIHEDYETETSAGIFKVNIMLSVAQSEADRTSERIRKVFEYKREKGEIVSGAVSYGYVIEDKKWVKDKKISHAIDKFYQHYLSTFKFAESYEIAKAAGLTCSYRCALFFLNNSRYYGSENYVSEPYITKEQYDLIQKNKATYPKENKYDYIFRGILTCGLCGCHMAGKRTITTKKDGTKTHSIFYLCSRHSHGYDCEGFTITEKCVEDYLINKLDSELNDFNLKIKAEQESLDHNQIISLKSKLTRLKNLYELGDMEFDEYKSKRAVITIELEQLNSVPLLQQKHMPSDWKEIYKELDIPHKNAFWMNILDHIEVTGRCCKSPKLFF